MEAIMTANRERLASRPRDTPGRHDPLNISDHNSARPAIPQPLRNGTYASGKVRQKVQVMSARIETLSCSPVLCGSWASSGRVILRNAAASHAPVRNRRRGPVRAVPESRLVGGPRVAALA